MRRPLIVANWKMHKSRAEARAYAETLLTALSSAPAGEIELAIAPPFTALETLARALAGSSVALAGQNVSGMPGGAFTGEVSVSMLKDLGCRYCIVGHSERRAQHGETSADVAGKAAALLKEGVRPIICVGETQAQREAGQTEEIVAEQVAASLPTMNTPAAGEVVVAYEPIWAIGTGVTATPEQAQEVQAFLRECLKKILGEGADRVRLQYGGSVGPDSIRSLMKQPDIDGALIGSAALDARTLETILANIQLENTSP
ncbi:MAG: triose-phosphate isomerase [Myxococcota bacterium]|jgi:triosephosphate isomerase (TIM)|nr:triose-phosphate isomerase [Myxococcota bacterium]